MSFTLTREHLHVLREAETKLSPGSSIIVVHTGKISVYNIYYQHDSSGDHKISWRLCPFDNINVIITGQFYYI